LAGAVADVGKPKPHTRLVLDALEHSGLPFDLRHVIRVYCDKANRKTGKGWSGHENIAGSLGCHKRTLIRMLNEIRQLSGAPWITWQRQPNKTGRGRGTDIYTVQVGSSFKVTDTSPETVDSKCQEGHLEEVTPAAFKVTPEAVQGDIPGTFKVTAVSHDPVRDPVNRSREISSASQSSAVGFSLVSQQQAETERPKKRPGPTKAKPEPKWPGVHPKAVTAYVEAFKRTRGADPFFGPPDAKAVSTLLDYVAGDLERFRLLVENGLANWPQATIRTIASDPSKSVTRRAANGYAAQPRQPSGGFDPTRYEQP